MEIENRLFWIDHAGFYTKIREQIVFIDPFRVSERIREKADIILITHPHFDHCSKSDIEKIVTKDTTIIAPNGCLEGEDYNIIRSGPEFESSFDNISIRAVPAYNTKKERLDFHKRSDQWVGYIIESDRFSIYHPGDTDFVEEMKSLNVDVALLPIGGTYTMDINEAINATKHIRAGTFIPMHYKSLLGEKGSQIAENEFRAKVSNSTILKQMQDPYYSF